MFRTIIPRGTIKKPKEEFLIKANAVVLITDYSLLRIANCHLALERDPSERNNISLSPGIVISLLLISVCRNDTAMNGTLHRFLETVIAASQ